MRNRVSISALAALSLLASCNRDKAAGTGGGTIIALMGGDATALIPLLAGDETTRAVTDLVFDHLAQMGDELSTVGDAGFEPRLAKSWDWARDSMSITFHLNPAARFHDGTPVTGNDVRYTFHLGKDTTLGSQQTPLLANIDSVSVPDSLTAVFWFKHRSPEQFYDAAYQTGIIPEHVYGKIKPAEMSTSELLRNPVGSGRFRLVKWEPGIRIELVADTSNYRGRAKVDRVVFVMTPSPVSAATALNTGQADFYATYPIDQAAGLDSSPTARRAPYRLNGYGFLGMNMNARKSQTRPHPILSELAVRRALSMSVDRKSMLTNVFNNNGVLSYGPFPTGVQTADTTLRLPPYDTTAAKALLDSAGWKVGPNGVRMKNGRPLKIEIMVPTSSQIRMRYADLVQEQLNRVGFQIELAQIAPQVFGPRLGTGDFDAMMLAINTDPSASGAKQYWGSEGIAAGSNFIRYHSALADAYLDSTSKARDSERVKRYARLAYQKIIDDAPAVWLYTSSSVAAVNRRIETKPFRGDGWWGHLADWSIPADKMIDRDRIGIRPQTP